MKLKISAIRDAGNLDKERIVMKVLAPTDIGEHLLLCTATADGKITTNIQTAYWFPDKEVKEGDFVVLYSKKGRDSEKEFKNAMSHFFYLGSDKALWDKSENAAVIMYAPDWARFQPEVPDEL